MKKTIGFIGSGNMGGAIIKGILKAELISPADVMASDVTAGALQALENQLGIKTSADNLDVAHFADILFLALKPNIYPVVLPQIRDHIKPDAIIVSIAAGQSIGMIEALVGSDKKVVRAMPNTPALVGEGMAAVCPNKLLTQPEVREITAIFGSIGKAETVEEKMMDIVTAISGSSPAYVYMFIEAMADAAAAEGMPRAQAYRFAAQAVCGSAKMVLQTGEHPGVLKDQVCSPGGTTIAAVCELEKRGMRSAVISAVKVCTEKSRDLGKAKV